MPVYNGDRFIGEAMDSVLNQTLTDFELIVVDDGSKDRTPEILETYADRDARVRVHTVSPNAGAIAARNTGTQLSRAEFIAVMDADDISLPTRLEKQAAYLEEHPFVGVVGTNVKLLDGGQSPKPIRTYPSQPALAAWSMAFFNSVAHPTVMIRREVLQKTNGYDPVCKGGSEDYDLFSRASSFTGVSNVPEVLLLYRKWEGNMTRTAWEAQEADANRIAGNVAARWLGERLPEALVGQLRGLATDRYPKTAADLKSVGDAVARLHDAFVRQTALTSEDKRLVARDAGVKLWLLAALAAKRSPVLAASLGRTALSISPASLPAFMSKAAARLTARR